MGDSNLFICNYGWRSRYIIEIKYRKLNDYLQENPVVIVCQTVSVPFTANLSVPHL